ncbi:MAG: FMN-binding protein [bacterium]|nr:FMN-binding protein [bacterium]
MDKNKLSIIRFAIILFIIVGSAGLILSLVYSITQPQILKNELAKEQDSLKIIMPEVQVFSNQGDHYRIFNDRKELIGYVFKTEAKGYGGPVRCNIGLDKQGKITGIFVVSHKETPGLGTKIEDVKKGETGPYYLAQYRNRPETEMNFENIKAISGATISSRAILNCVKNAFVRFHEVNEKN